MSHKPIDNRLWRDRPGAKRAYGEQQEADRFFRSPEARVAQQGGSGPPKSCRRCQPFIRADSEDIAAALASGLRWRLLQAAPPVAPHSGFRCLALYRQIKSQQPASPQFFFSLAPARASLSLSC